MKILLGGSTENQRTYFYNELPEGQWFGICTNYLLGKEDAIETLLTWESNGDERDMLINGGLPELIMETGKGHNYLQNRYDLAYILPGGDLRYEQICKEAGIPIVYILDLVKNDTRKYIRRNMKEAFLYDMETREKYLEKGLVA